jgi:hypothetical protein
MLLRPRRNGKIKVPMLFAMAAKQFYNAAQVAAHPRELALATRAINPREVFSVALLLVHLSTFPISVRCGELNPQTRGSVRDGQMWASVSEVKAIACADPCGDVHQIALAVACRRRHQPQPQLRARDRRAAVEHLPDEAKQITAPGPCAQAIIEPRGAAICAFTEAGRA